MAKIVDPDYLNVGVNVLFDTTNKLIELVTGGTSGFTDDGVTLQALYSFTKERWKSDINLIKYPFPYVSITAEQFELVDGWNHMSGVTNNYIRDGGWALKDLTGGTQEIFMNLTTLGSFYSVNDRAYYQQQTNGIGTQTIYNGPVNQAIKIYGDAAHGNFDYTTYFKIYLRGQGEIYSFYDLIDEQNLASLTYKKYALPLSNSSDLKISAADNIISGSTPYIGMSINYYSGVTSGQTRTIGGVDYVFSIIVNGGGGTAEQIYSYVAYKLRQQADIDAQSGIVSGYTAEELMGFVGDTLKTKHTSLGGVYIDNFQAGDTNRLVFRDDANLTDISYPYVASGTINFNDNLKNDPGGTYWVFFTTLPSGATFDSSGATLINDNNGSPLSGSCYNQSSIIFSYDYQGNNQGGRTPNTDAAYTAVAIGLETGQYVKTTGTLTRSTANSINFVAALERNYSNP